MKPILLTSVVAGSLLLAVVSPTLAAETEGLPPGLQKKDKLPPGWQKKQAGKKGGPATAATAATNAASPSVTPPSAPPASTPTPTTAGTVPPAAPAPKAPSTPGSVTETKAPSGPAVSSKPLTREQQQNLARMERALADLEAQAKRAGASDRLLHRLSNRQQVSNTVLQGQLKSNPGLTVPQLYLATLIGRESRTPVDKILAERRQGVAWSEIAHSRKVQFSDMAERLRAAEEAAKEAANQEEKRVRRDAARS